MVPARIAGLIFTLMAAGCATGIKDVIVKPGSGFNKKTPAIIQAEHGDPYGVKAILEERFRARGFTIVTGMSDTPEFAVRFRYLFLLDMGIRDFEASITPTRGGGPIALLRFQGRGFVDVNVMAEELLAGLEEQLK